MSLVIMLAGCSSDEIEDTTNEATNEEDGNTTTEAANGLEGDADAEEMDPEDNELIPSIEYIDDSSEMEWYADPDWNDDYDTTIISVDRSVYINFAVTKYESPAQAESEIQGWAALLSESADISHLSDAADAFLGEHSGFTAKMFRWKDIIGETIVVPESPETRSDNEMIAKEFSNIVVTYWKNELG
ncbi:hypothetical protein [Halopiger aswanensis]|uniref:Uncharacterized protein n=1 Tax=Halopiger aswanensis TaxID=148449 RepID=A0A3R7HFP7_9EURY|nr:hypothetical protein [Halopiger aswanensis]RKD86282.1 hypothetical protein ATJ93_4610 [Halopiger aswanensis]